MHIRRIASAVLVIALAAALGGCGKDKDESATSKSQAAKVFSEDELKTSLLRTADVGGDYRIKDEEDDQPGPGCLKELDGIDDGFASSDEHVEITIEANTESAIPEADQLTSSFKTEDDAKTALKEFADSFKDCDHVKETDDDGRVTTIDLTFSDDTSDSRVEDQFNLDAVGTVASSGQEVPVSIRIRFMRIDNVITAVGITSIIDTDTSDATDDLAVLALERLTALIEGKDQPELDSLDLPVFTV